MDAVILHCVLLISSLYVCANRLGVCLADGASVDIVDAGVLLWVIVAPFQLLVPKLVGSGGTGGGRCLVGSLGA